ncbi:group III truncated hemoglobin [Haloferula sp. BvORR071]|uniref:group III truncated hemoglobin n=1 Tax=Haloferula sp. BvORR071 TaxID=1396141 RepID=UPI000698B8E3|nr:group III truncated hemoglobin [Haloferula sp. BvORR071]
METQACVNLKGDILGRPEIEILVDRFYAMVRQDAVLGPVFDVIARVNWDEHIPKLCDFWETVLFRTGGYKGNPLAAHFALTRDATMDRAMFDGWLLLFKQAVDADFAGENAEHIKRVAADMANVIHSRLQAAAITPLPAIPGRSYADYRRREPSVPPGR